MTVIQLREPLKTYFEQLEKFQFKPSRDGTQIETGHWNIGLPPLDPDEARELAAELNKAVLPIIKKFSARKLEEFLKSAIVDRPPGLTNL